MSWFVLLGMAVIIFMSRYVFLEPKLPMVLGPHLQRLLTYSAPAVLSAIVAPLIFIEGEQLHIGLQNRYFVGAIIACLLIVVTRNTLLTVLVSMGLFFFAL
ncbi:AzlD domain-containing protein [Pseudoalteromonas sp. MMG013]|uniref:AzlD domain-containing protein n=1 Tax=unclassified Pseudoalteromonas TaxID=194690 RepID=UPI001B387268|nr:MULTISPECIES: AzlD domain-containing protein [unclassified Pseudoalteromonas]MBQ4847377.1 AzlD domain-containing protein [Pseudoalteromonas sp. MMG005]MBQ4851451.1 AzlD domain-containing protein [Pseudoalteromonas sp. MMG012]MBQ4861620.1 AzlD domain-containing protein [Pseudoalteromonas sp. MMG013]